MIYWRYHNVLISNEVSIILKFNSLTFEYFVKFNVNLSVSSNLLPKLLFNLTKSYSILINQYSSNEFIYKIQKLV
jgi:hypothetical protein